jgi:hypothetical protein
MNQSAVFCGVPGSGKSLLTKWVIDTLILNSQDDILICDPEAEYVPLVQALAGKDGSVISVSAGGRDRLNAMLWWTLGENKPIVVKSQFVMSLSS